MLSQVRRFISTEASKRYFRFDQQGKKTFKSHSEWPILIVKKSEIMTDWLSDCWEKMTNKKGKLGSCRELRGLGRNPAVDRKRATSTSAVNTSASTSTSGTSTVHGGAPAPLSGQGRRRRMPPPPPDQRQLFYHVFRLLMPPCPCVCMALFLRLLRLYSDEKQHLLIHDVEKQMAALERGSWQIVNNCITTNKTFDSGRRPETATIASDFTWRYFLSFRMIWQYRFFLCSENNQSCKCQLRSVLRHLRITSKQRNFLFYTCMMWERCQYLSCVVFFYLG